MLINNKLTNLLLLQGREKPNIWTMWEEYMDGHQTDWADSAKSRTRGGT